MVSVFFTSPWDHDLSWSGVARPILSLSKSLTSNKRLTSLQNYQHLERRCGHLKLVSAVAFPVFFGSRGKQGGGSAAKINAEILGRMHEFLIRFAYLDLEALLGKHFHVED